MLTVQVEAAVTLEVEPSENVPVAVKLSEDPIVIVGFPGVTAIDCRVSVVGFVHVSVV